MGIHSLQLKSPAFNHTTRNSPGVGPRNFQSQKRKTTSKSVNPLIVSLIPQLGRTRVLRVGPVSSDKPAAQLVAISAFATSATTFQTSGRSVQQVDQVSRFLVTGIGGSLLLEPGSPTRLGVEHTPTIYSGLAYVAALMISYPTKVSSFSTQASWPGGMA